MVFFLFFFLHLDFARIALCKRNSSKARKERIAELQDRETFKTPPQKGCCRQSNWSPYSRDVKFGGQEKTFFSRQGELCCGVVQGCVHLQGMMGNKWWLLTTTVISPQGSEVLKSSPVFTRPEQWQLKATISKTPWEGLFPLTSLHVQKTGWEQREVRGNRTAPLSSARPWSASSRIYIK